MTIKKCTPRPGRSLAACLLAALMVVPPGSIPAASAADAPTVDGFSISPDKVQIELSGETQYTSRVSASPPRLILDLAGAEYRADGKTFGGKGKFLKGVRASQFQGKPDLVSRVVLDLSEATAYQISRNDEGLLVVLGSAAEPAKEAAAEPSSSGKGAPDLSEIAERAAGAPAEPAPAVKPLAAAAPAVKPGVGETGGMTTKASAELGEIAERSEAASDGASPASEPAAAPAAPVAESRKAVVDSDVMARLPHDLVSVDFDNTDVKEVIKLLSAKAKLNIIYGEDVAGNLTLHLVDVPFDEAFRTILAMLNLSTSQIGSNILRVLTPAALVKTQKAAATTTKVFTLNYSKPSEVLPTINQVREAEGRAGTAIAADKTNSLIVTESVEGMPKTAILVAQLDQRPKQVLIETKIVEVSLSKSMDYGVSWSYAEFDRGKVGGKQGFNSIGAPLGPAVANTIALPADGAGNIGTTGFGKGSLPGAANGGTGVSLAQPAFGALSLGRITNNYFLNASLMAAASDGKVKVLSDPKIATLNNQPASINVNTNVPYVTQNVSATGAQTQTVTYVPEGITLTVTPTINSDGRITLNVNPSITEPAAASLTNTATGAPGTNTRSAQTTVIVRNGETIVIGGLISDRNETTISKVPVLGDIPILGWLFKSKAITRVRTELLIFVTTKLLID